MHHSEIEELENDFTNDKFFPEMKAIIDCNSFYCGCERLFQPQLHNQPVVVLSNNDGCIISRTDEAKELGVKMAGPYFLARPFIEEFNVATFSSNYHLYGDMSWRVMETLRIILGAENVEVYSVDEAFLDLDGYDDEALYNIALQIRHTVEQWTGIKVSIGVAPTKVLSKIANHLAKKNKIATECVVVLTKIEDIEQALQNTPVGEVWGIGRKYAQKLKDDFAIFTAYDLSHKNEEWARKNMGGVVGVRLLQELKSICCSTTEEELITKKMIATTRMFGRTVSSIIEIKEAIATYTSRAAEKLRRQHAVAGCISIFIVPKQLQAQESYHRAPSISASFTLPIATAATQELIVIATQLVEQIFIAGTKYKKAGVTLSAIVDENSVQGNLFFEDTNPAKNKALMSTIDNVNFSMRGDMVKFASSGTTRDWKMRCEHRSPRYTTRWEEMYEVS